ncbi:ATP-grasp domain-containing protein [Crateriforma spongiae]|uniref:ATP-grasp domain-containing protein n=1 Tax=Crateriforma spongiae TaxID=2724528 RepID=UPI0014459724|nr:ATP-grasp domain-containing protein [Crateriforma spongiae]
MRVFVAEFICGGGFLHTSVDGIPESLRREGAAMLSALVEDTTGVADVVTPVDTRLNPSLVDVDHLSIRPVDPAGGPIWAQWIESATGCDHAIIVAPESNGHLAQGIAMLRAAGIDCVAGSGDFLRVASDKILTAKTLHTAGVKHPLFMAEGERRHRRSLSKCDRFILKPRDGCGTQMIAKFDDLDTAISQMTPQDILQEFRPGRPVSIALIADDAGLKFLPAAAQFFDVETCIYSGGRGPLCDDDQRRAMALASRAIEAMPPRARGYIGIDLILGDRPGDDCVIEINPRLTTSYVGLRRMTSCNLAAQILGIETQAICCDVGVDDVSWTSEGDIAVATEIPLSDAGRP